MVVPRVAMAALAVALLAPVAAGEQLINVPKCEVLYGGEWADCTGYIAARGLGLPVETYDFGLRAAESCGGTSSSAVLSPRLPEGPTCHVWVAFVVGNATVPVPHVPIVP